MIRAEQDGGVVEHAGALENVDKLAELVVDVGNVGEVTASRTAHLFRRDLEGLIVAGTIQTLRMHILLVMWDERSFRIERLAILVEIPVLLARNIRIVRVG